MLVIYSPHACFSAGADLRERAAMTPAEVRDFLDLLGGTISALERLTHDMCYLYGRATKAGSICPPAYYADLACERGRSFIDVLLRSSPPDADGQSSTTGRSGPRTPEERAAEKDRVFERAQELWGNGVHDDLKNSMFYI